MKESLLPLRQRKYTIGTDALPWNFSTCTVDASCYSLAVANAINALINKYQISGAEILQLANNRSNSFGMIDAVKKLNQKLNKKIILRPAQRSVGNVIRYINNHLESGNKLIFSVIFDHWEAIIKEKTPESGIRSRLSRKFGQSNHTILIYGRRDDGFLIYESNHRDGLILGGDVLSYLNSFLWDTFDIVGIQNK